MTDHEAARAWLSAFRDAEAADDPANRDHLERCARCRGWAGALDGVGAAVGGAQRAAVPDVTAPALAAWQRAASTPGRDRAARLVLAAAGVAGLVLAAVSLFVLPGAGAGLHSRHDLLGFQAAFSVGFLLCGLDPDRYRSALLPLTAAASVGVALPSAAATATTGVALLTEAGHLPLLAGLAGLLLLADARRPRGWPPTLVP